MPIHMSMAPELYLQKWHVLPGRVQHKQHTGLGLFTRLISSPQRREQNPREKSIEEVYFYPREENRKARRTGSQCRVLMWPSKKDLEEKKEAARREKLEASWPTPEFYQMTIHCSYTESSLRALYLLPNLLVHYRQTTNAVQIAWISEQATDSSWWVISY